MIGESRHDVLRLAAFQRLAHLVPHAMGLADRLQKGGIDDLVEAQASELDTAVGVAEDDPLMPHPYLSRALRCRAEHVPLKRTHAGSPRGA